MTAKRTLSRRKRRSLIYDIITGLIQLYGLSDNELESIPMQKLTNIRFDTLDWHKHLNIEHREYSDSYICVNGGDAMPCAVTKKDNSLN